MIGLAPAFLWAVIAGAMCYLLGRKHSYGDDGRGGKLDSGGVPPPTITRLSTTRRDDVVAP